MITSVGVTSFTLVWIKIIFVGVEPENVMVTSFTLVWIKISDWLISADVFSSRASRSCGLKW